MPENMLLRIKEQLSWTFWNIQDDGALECLFYREDVRVKLAEKDLTALHPDLPAAAYAQLRWLHRSEAHKPLHGLNIENQLHYLTQSPLLLPEFSPGERHYAAQLLALQRTSTPGALLLTTWFYRVARVDNVDFVVPNSEDMDTCALPFAWLDTHFPGWLPRFEAAEFLGLSGEDLIAHVLTTNQSPVPATVDTKDITFD